MDRNSAFEHGATHITESMSAYSDHAYIHKRDMGRLGVGLGKVGETATHGCIIGHEP
jgi:hypothetical protein